MNLTFKDTLELETVKVRNLHAKSEIFIINIMELYAKLHWTLKQGILKIKVNNKVFNG